MPRQHGIVAAIAVALTLAVAGHAWAIDSKSLPPSSTDPQAVQGVTPASVVATPKPDLVVKQDSSVSKKDLQLGYVQWKVHVRNEGKKKAGPSTLCLTIRNENNELKASAEKPIPALNVNTGTWITIEASYGSVLDYISTDVVADCKNVIDESNENNNRKNAQLAP